MFSRALITSCLMLLISVPVQAAVVGARAVPDATAGRMAPRAFVSGGNTCYYRCPDTFTAGDGQAAFNPSTPGGGVCNYNNGAGVNYQCNYSGTGELNTANSDTGCPARATDAGCIPTGNTPDANTFKRRNTRVLTRAQKIIKARQFRPKKVTRRRA